MLPALQIAACRRPAPAILQIHAGGEVADDFDIGSYDKNV
jgi:hypothetical protein